MAFRLIDVKKTVRSRSDGERYIHPRLLDGPSITAQVGLALAYFNSRLGRARHEFEPEVLVRFFGEPKVARGLVTCLSGVYRWRPREFADVLPPADLARLASRGLATPGDLRLYLFDLLNKDGDGFLDSPREEHLEAVARRLRLSPAKLDQLVALDAEENAVLMRTGAVPSPQEVVALYNHHAVAAMLRHCAWLDLPAPPAAALAALQEACLAAGVTCTHDGPTVRLHNRADVFGSYARSGGALLRTVLGAAASAPDLLRSGQASVPVGGKQALYLLEKPTLKALTGGTGRVLCAAGLPALREAWGRRRATLGVEGWRLLAQPEPVLSPAGLAVAPYACRRGDAEVLLWPVAAAGNLAAAAALAGAGLAVLPILLDGVDTGTASLEILHARGTEPAAIVAALGEGWGGRRAEPATQALASLLEEVRTRGFVPEAQASEALGCAAPDELAAHLRALDPAAATHVPGLGLCSPAFAAQMRKGLRRRTRRPAA